MSKKVWVSLLAAGVLVAGVFFGINAVKTVSADTDIPATGMYGMMERGRGGFGVTNEGLATALGISVDELTTAYQTATDKALEQAVAADLITQTQADAIKARGEFSFWSAPGRLPGRQRYRLPGFAGGCPGHLYGRIDSCLSTLHTLRRSRMQSLPATSTQEQADLMLGRQALRNSRPINPA